MQQRMGRPHLKLLQEVDTKWNGTYIMLQRLYEEREPVGAALVSMRTDLAPITAEEYHSVKECDGLWDLLDSHVVERQVRNATADATAEVQRYMADPLIPRTEDPLHFWRDEASIKYQDVIEHMKLLQLLTQEDEEAQRRQEAELKLHRDAFVESLNGPYLFMIMFQDDPEAETLCCVPGIASLKSFLEFLDLALAFKHQMVELSEHKRREAESGAEFRHLSIPDAFKVKTNQSNEIDQLCKSLMTLEFQAISQLEDNIRKLEQNISDTVDNFSKTALDIYPFSTQKYTAMDALATGHDIHLLKISDRETNQDKELKLNRMRISDTQRFVEYLKERLEL
ncbi:leucine-rich repeat-containing protein 48-like [Stegastes partitus]|uniref:Leucine-rich repeat-containing protein 48-like n=1 Tax=Stegastes partitus TaxID=144197 RepID=A0A9Y4N074_9TELE|nr:PREDICTED: leucine-rich repeat-containing protein 48-like [Stegastes partitus]